MIGNHKPEPHLWWTIADRIGVPGNHKPHETRRERDASIPGCANQH